MKSQVLKWVESSIFRNFIMVIILLNAATLGIETVHSLSDTIMELLHLFDKICLAIFIVEILMKLYVYGLTFFKKPWCVFDFLIVGVTLIPNTGNLSVLRGLRVLRVLRLISAIPQLRIVVNAFLDSLPGVGAVAMLFSVIFYVFSVMSTQIFGAEFPAYFGSLTTSMFTLFQLMTLENWASIVKEVMAVYSWAGAFFIVYILIATFVLLNMVIAVVVKVMEGQELDPHTETLNEISKRLAKIEKKLK